MPLRSPTPSPFESWKERGRSHRRLRASTRSLKWWAERLSLCPGLGCGSEEGQGECEGSSEQGWGEAEGAAIAEEGSGAGSAADHELPPKATKWTI